VELRLQIAIACLHCGQSGTTQSPAVIDRNVLSRAAPLYVIAHSIASAFALSPATRQQVADAISSLGHKNRMSANTTGQPGFLISPVVSTEESSRQ